MSEQLAQHFLLRDDVVFLNHGSYGACPRQVFAAYQAWQLELERQPVAFLDPVQGYRKWMLDVRVALAAELGADPEDIVGVVNATFGLNVVAQSLNLQPGDEILTTDHEYGALEKTWAFVARKTGARIVEMPVPIPLVSAEQFTQAVMAGFTDRTKVLFLSHITSPTALLFPIEELVAEARRRGVISVIDGAHTPGHIPLDLDALGADFYSGNCHKWMMAPKGSAFLHARRDMQAMINPLVISHAWTPESNQPGAKGPFGGSAFVEEFEVQGTRDPAAWLTVPAAIAFGKEHHWASVAAYCHGLAMETAERVAKLTGLAPLSTSQLCAPQMVAMPVPNCDPVALKATLMEKYHIEIPVFNWHEHTIVRLSVQGYNTRAQMDVLVNALRDTLSGLP